MSKIFVLVLFGMLSTTNAAMAEGSSVWLNNGPIQSSIDNYGSSIRFDIIAPKLVTNTTYVGPVKIVGAVTIVKGINCANGVYALKGNGTWVSGFGGSQGKLEVEEFDLVGAQKYNGTNMTGLIYKGQDPYSAAHTDYFFQGNFKSFCDEHAIAL